MKFIQVQLHYSPLNFLFFDSVGSIPIHFHFKLKNAIKTLGIALNRTQRSNRPNGLWKWKFHVILLPHIYLPPSTGSLLKNSMAVVENWIQSQRCMKRRGKNIIHQTRGPSSRFTTKTDEDERFSLFGSLLAPSLSWSPFLSHPPPPLFHIMVEAFIFISMLLAAASSPDKAYHRYGNSVRQAIATLRIQDIRMQEARRRRRPVSTLLRFIWYSFRSLFLGIAIWQIFS